MRKKNRVQVAVFSFCLLLMTIIASAEEITLHLPDKLTLSGEGIVLGRLCQPDSAACTASTPYHGGYYVNFLFKINVNENVRLEDILTAENQSFSAGYGLRNVLRNRFTAFYETEAVKLKAGNLGRIKAGNGLTIDALYSDGINLSLGLGKFNLDLLLSGAGLVLLEDLYIFQLTDRQKRFGIFTNIHSGQKSPVRNVVYTGIFAGSSLSKHINLYGEFASAAKDGVKFFTGKDAYLLGVRYAGKYHKLNLEGDLEYRFYDDSFNQPLRYQPQDNFFAIEEEDKRFNNWWNYLYIFGRLSALAYSLKADYPISKRFRLFTDYEYIDLTAKDNILNYKAKGHVNLYKTGFDYFLDNNKKAYFSFNFSNKFLNGKDTGMIYNLQRAKYSSYEFHFMF